MYNDEAEAVRAFTDQFLHRNAADDSETETDPNVPPPKLDEAMFYGIVGDVARAAANGTEVNPVAAATNFLSFLGAMAGRDVYLPIGNTRHHPRIYTNHVGRSGRGGKGDARGLIDRIRWYIAEHYPDCLGQTHSGGLSSREGLALLIHDGFRQGKNEFPAIEDKRLWVVESEFANVLHQSKRDGNTLSAALRDAWDGVSIKPAVKASRVWASHPHIGIHASITPLELRASIDARDLTNGFANRFLPIWAERVGTVPFPQPTPLGQVIDLAERLQKIIAFARGDYPARWDTRPMRLSDAASRGYARIYKGELTRPETSDLLTALLERQAPYLLRLAMLFALTDLSLLITEEHIEAALAWIRYSKQSVRFIFGDAAEIAKSDRRLTDAKRIVLFLKARPDGASRRDLINDCFQKNSSADRIDDAIRTLLVSSTPAIAATMMPRTDGKPGKGRQVYQFIAASDGHDGHRSTAPDTQDDPGDQENGHRTSTTPESDPCPLSPLPYGPSEMRADNLSPLSPFPNASEHQYQVPHDQGDTTQGFQSQGPGTSEREGVIEGIV